MQFNNIRPYKNDEIEEAMSRLLKEHEFFQGLQYFCPEWNKEDIINKAKNIKRSIDFQKIFMYKAVTGILKNSSEGFSYSGIKNIKPNEAYLYIANHRDIFLDSALLQLILFENNINTTQITFGSNLMSSQLLIDIGKINKMFTVLRSTDKQKMYKISIMLSKYIRNTICTSKESVWIAQRNGRTKDGNDSTQSGLLKMLNISSDKDFIKSFGDLKIVPLSISYEYEPCDQYKVLELLESKKSTYKKKPGEDLQSIISGIAENKGKIHITIGKPVISKLKKINQSNNYKEKINLLAKEIDQQIHSNYRLWKTNYIAYDILEQSNKFSEYYSEEDKKAFINYLEKKEVNFKEDHDEFEKIFLKIYSNPVKNSKL